MKQYRINGTSTRLIFDEHNGKVEMFNPGSPPSWTLVAAAIEELGKKEKVEARSETEIDENLGYWSSGTNHRIEFLSAATRWRGWNYDLVVKWECNRGGWLFEQRLTLAHFHISSAGTANGRISAKLTDLLLMLQKIKGEDSTPMFPRTFLIDEGQPRRAD